MHYRLSSCILPKERHEAVPRCLEAQDFLLSFQLISTTPTFLFYDSIDKLPKGPIFGTVGNLLVSAHIYNMEGKSSTQNGEIERFFSRCLPIDNVQMSDCSDREIFITKL